MNGILLVDKPRDWTSFDVCAKLRHVFGEKRVGHSGTLDPLATGLLVVFLGKATRAVSFAEAQEKTYEAALRLGLATDTQDITGAVLENRLVSVTREELEAVLPRFRGEILQVPPMYSAIKVQGKPLYALARQGKDVERKPRPVTVYSLECSGQRGGDWMLTVRCSKGTYIRTLCSDIGAALGCGGAMSSLRRTRCGAYSVSDAHSPEVISAAVEKGRWEELLLPLDSLFPEAERMDLTSNQERAIRNGGSFSSRCPEGSYRLYGADGEFLALAEVREGVMTPVKRFF